jgi:holo-[acyl-carrier protein] synthase
MTISIGIDLTSADAVAQSLQDHGARYLERVYTDRERRDCTQPSGGSDAERLAARFAAKEATLKALRREDESIPWTSIGVCSDRAGRPSLELSGPAAALARRRGVAELSVSLTHEGPFAAAVVVAHLQEAR